MKLYDGGKIIAGMLIFFILLAFPIWYNLASGKATYRPDPQLPTQEKKCVRDADYMVHYHMDILDDWRERVVREGERFVTINNTRYEMSLTKTCLNCHSNKSRFCDECHNYLAVDPYCWDCHVIPQEEK